MKKIIIYTLLLAIPAASFCQSTPNNAPAVKTDYLQKSKSQKTAAWIMLGSTVAIIGIAAPGNISFDALPALVAVGALSTAGSITLFIASGRNKRKAMTATTYLKMQTMPLAGWNSFVQKSYPSLAVKINLK